MIIYCNAKINLTLDMAGLREDGYHLLRSVMHPIPLCDRIKIEQAEGISLRCNIPYIPLDERNLVFKAAKLFFEKTGIKGGMRADITKHIPSGAGLGGGSSDAAGTLKALNALYRVNADSIQLCKWAAELGADVPFFIENKPALAEGIGEILTPCDALPSCELMIVRPDFAVNTKWAYGEIGDSREEGRTDSMLSALRSGTLSEIAEAAHNGMQKTVSIKYPQINDLCKTLENNGAACALMSGSGSAVFGLFEKGTRLRSHKKDFPDCFTFCCTLE